jgi:dTDP-4-dehydrorhamnose reductase
MTNVLVLGATGMLGSMVLSYMRDQVGVDVRGSYRGTIPEVFRDIEGQMLPFDASKDPESELKNSASVFVPDYVVNCIGVIKPHCQDNDPAGVIRAIEINALFPHLLAKAVKAVHPRAKIIQIATDCVFSGKVGKYDELAKHDPLDVYGKTKSLGEVHADHLLNVRVSILGPEIKGNLSLLEWFLSQPKGARLKGFAHHEWNGVTTLQFAEMCVMLMRGNSFAKWRAKGSRLHYVINETVDKYQLLTLMNDVYQKDYVIDRVSDVGEPVLRTLASRLLPMESRPMKHTLSQLRDYSRKMPWYHRTL